MKKITFFFLAKLQLTALKTKIIKIKILEDRIKR